MTAEGKQYAERNPIELDRAGGYYIRHVYALTAEDLHGKSEIAAELGYRDMEIDRLKAAVSKLNNDLQRIAKFFDGVLIGDDIADKIIELLKTHVIMSEPAAPASKQRSFDLHGEVECGHCQGRLTVTDTEGVNWPCPQCPPTAEYPKMQPSAHSGYFTAEDMRAYVDADRAQRPKAVPMMLPEPDFWVRPGATIHPDRGWQCWSNDGTATGAYHAQTVRALLVGVSAQSDAVIKWQSGVGLMWDVFAFGKWLLRVVSPLNWDAHSVYQELVRSGYAEHIDVRQIHSENTAAPQAPASQGGIAC